MSDGRAIDHLVLVSKSLDTTANRYESLGFTCTPRAQHEDRMGTSNQLAQFAQKNFIELLEVDRPAKLQPHDFQSDPPFFSFGAYNRDWPGVQPGLSMMVFAGDDSRADHARFLQAGIQTFAPFDFERVATLPDGSQVTVSFRLTFASSPNMPAIGFFVCQNCAPEHFWKPAFQSHDNGALGIECVYIASLAPERDAEFLGRLFGGSVVAIDGGFEVGNGVEQSTRIVLPDFIGTIDGDFRFDSGVGPALAGVRIATSQAKQETIRSDSADGCFIEWSHHD